MVQSLIKLFYSMCKNLSCNESGDWKFVFAATHGYREIFARQVEVDVEDVVMNFYQCPQA